MGNIYMTDDYDFLFFFHIENMNLVKLINYVNESNTIQSWSNAIVLF